MGKLRPSVEIVTPALPERQGLLEECHKRVMRQTYALDFGGTVLHTIVVDGGHGDMPVWPDARWLWLEGGPHHDHGSAAINYGVQHRLCDYLMQVADDEWLEDTAVQQLVYALQWAAADFAMCHRDWPGRPGVLVTGDPPVATNLTTGLFNPGWWSVADMVSGPSGLYTQPGADGQQAWDWLQRGAKLAIVPQILSHNVQ